jgi:hypothetical protein
MLLRDVWPGKGFPRLRKRREPSTRVRRRSGSRRSVSGSLQDLIGALCAFGSGREERNSRRFWTETHGYPGMVSLPNQ